MAFNFTDKITEADADCTLIVDALNLAFRWKHQGRSDFRYEYQKTVESLAKSYGCGNIIMTADWVDNIPVGRLDVNPKYLKSFTML